MDYGTGTDVGSNWEIFFGEAVRYLLEIEL